MSQWRVVDFLKYSGTVAAKQGRLIAGENSLPLSDVSVVLLGPQCQVHASFLDRAAEFDFPILACDWRHVPYSVVLPWSENTRVGSRHIAQSRLTEGRRKNAWMQIVKAKIRGQAHNLGSLPSGTRLTELAKEVRSGDPSNCEAQAARLYWESYFLDEPDFYRDSQQGFGRNALLNYGYTVLRGHVIRSIVEAGLWPTLGVWHRGRSNVFALADDLIEPFRPAVDSIVMQLPRDCEVSDPGIRQMLVSASDLEFDRGGLTVQTHIQRLSQAYAQYVEGARDVLPVRSWGQKARKNG